MANIRLSDLGAPPASVIPVYRDVQAAGQVGRQVSELAGQLGSVMAEIKQRKTALADTATQQYANQQVQSIKDAVAQSMTDNPNDPDTWRRTFAQNMVKVPTAVSDYAAKNDLPSNRSSLVMQGVNGQLEALAADVERSVSSYRVKENNATIFQSAQLAADNNDMKAAESLVNSMELSPSERRENILKLQTNGLRNRMTAAISAAATPEDASSLGYQLAQTDDKGAFVIQGMSVYDRQALMDRAAQKQRELEAKQAQDNATAYRQALVVSARTATRLVSSLQSSQSLDRLLAATGTGSRDTISDAIGADVTDERLRGTFVDALLRVSEDENASAQFYSALEARKSTVATQELAAETRALEAERGRLATFSSLQSNIAKGKGTRVAVDALHDVKHISDEQYNSLVAQIDASVEATLGQNLSIYDDLALRYYDSFRRFYGGDKPLTGEQISQDAKGAVTDRMVSRMFGRSTYQDYNDFMDRILKDKENKEFPTDESKMRAIQNAAFLQLMDLNDGALENAGWAWRDEKLSPTVVTRAKQLYGEFLNMTATQRLEPRDAGRRLQRITARIMEIQDKYGDDPKAVNKAFDDLSGSEKKEVSRQAAEEVFQ